VEVVDTNTRASRAAAVRQDVPAVLFDDFHRADFLSQPLGGVSQRAVEKGEPMWSDLVVSTETQRPLSGFYGMARRLRSEMPVANG
jgi:hypothetical protein